MKPPRVSPWDIEYIIGLGPAAAEVWAEEWGKRPRLGRRSGRYLPNYRLRRYLLGAFGAALLGLCVLGTLQPAVKDVVFMTAWMPATVGLILVAVSGALLIALSNQLRHPWLRSPTRASAYMAGRLRVAPYRIAIRRGDAQRLLVQHLERVTFWRNRVEGPATPGSGGRYTKSRSWYSALQPASVAVFIYGMYHFSRPSATTFFGLLGGPLLVAGAAVMAFYPWGYRGSRERLRRALAESRCPGCLYDLAGAPPALPNVSAAGPERCPECGIPWPLVPPPVPE